MTADPYAERLARARAAYLAAAGEEETRRALEGYIMAKDGTPGAPAPDDVDEITADLAERVVVALALAGTGQDPFAVAAGVGMPALLFECALSIGAAEADRLDAAPSARAVEDLAPAATLARGVRACLELTSADGTPALVLFVPSPDEAGTVRAFRKRATRAGWDAVRDAVGGMRP